MTSTQELYAAAAADHPGYIREVLRLRDRVVAVRARLPHRECQFEKCPAVGTVLRGVTALGSDVLIDHALLHSAFDAAEGHLDGR